MTDTLSSAEIETRLADHPDWSMVDDMLQADFVMRDFAHAILFVCAVAHLAEAMDHHPDILIHGYKRVRLRLMSHDVSGISARDFGMVVAIEAIALDGSGEG